MYHARLASFWRETPEELATLPLARYIIYDMRKVAEREVMKFEYIPGETRPRWAQPHILPVSLERTVDPRAS